MSGRHGSSFVRAPDHSPFINPNAMFQPKAPPPRPPRDLSLQNNQYKGRSIQATIARANAETRRLAHGRPVLTKSPKKVKPRVPTAQEKFRQQSMRPTDIPRLPRTRFHPSIGESL